MSPFDGEGTHSLKLFKGGCMSSRSKKKAKRQNHGKQRPVETNRDKLPLSTEAVLWIIAVAVAARALLTLLPSYKIDMGGYRAWSIYLSQKGFDGFYENFHVVYGPAYLYLLWISGKLAQLLSLSQFAHEYIIKLWAVFSDFIGGFLIYRIGGRYAKQRLGFLLGVAYVLNPAVFFNSSIWGQFDSIPAAMLLGVIYCFNFRKDIAAVMLFAASVLTKPQSMVLAPIVLILFFKDFSIFRGHWEKSENREQAPENRKSWVELCLAIVGSLAVYYLISRPFSSGRPIYWIADLYLRSGGDYPYATANGFNLWTLLGGQAVNDSAPFLGLTYALWSMLLLLAVCALSVYFLLKKKRSVPMLYLASYFLSFGAFMFGSRMHERYLFPAVIFLMASILWDTKLWIPASVLSLCHLGNQWYIYELAKKEIFWVSTRDSMAVFIALVTLMVMGYSAYYIFSKVVNAKGHTQGNRFMQG
jgi:Gpi18-like mannosyltransferase